MQQTYTNLQFAVNYAKLGLAVFPIVFRNKKPLTPNGCKDATTDLKTIETWWTKYPNANIGIATGQMSGGLVVVDLDVDEEKGKDGKNELRNWELDNGDLAETWTSITGRGGSHLFYRIPEPVGNRVNILDGVDIRGDGGYIVAPPSVHPNGNPYEWDLSPGDVEISIADETLYKLLAVGNDKEAKEPIKAPNVIQEGGRNEMLYKLACSLQERGYSDAGIKALIVTENLEKCNPPLPNHEIETILKSATKHPKGELRVRIYDAKPDLYYSLKCNEKTKKPCNHIENVRIVLEEDENLKGKIKYNAFAFAPWVMGCLPWDTSDCNREWTNTDDANLKLYIEKNYDISGTEIIMDALEVVTKRNQFNPVTDLLESLEWDGKPHIENLLPDFLGVDKNEYSIACMRTFMLGAITRAFKPGSKFDYMPVLVGGQGVGKSTFIKMLAINEEWAEDNFNTVEGDKACEKLRSKWIIELAELLAAKRAKEVESMKAFLTSTHDNYRQPYARRSESRARQCVFAGTTNNNRFLTDKTGNRRYLPLVVDKNKVKTPIFDDYDAAKAEIMKAWAEAMEIYRSGDYSLVLPKHLQDQVEDMQEAYVEEDSRVGFIQKFLDDTREKYVSVAMIYHLALGEEDRKPNRRESNEIHDIMENCIDGWARVQNASNGKVRHSVYGNQICYERVSAQMDFEPIGNTKLPFDN